MTDNSPVAVWTKYQNSADGFIQPISKDEYQTQVEELHAALGVAIRKNKVLKWPAEIDELDIERAAHAETKQRLDQMITLRRETNASLRRKVVPHE